MIDSNPIRGGDRSVHPTISVGGSVFHRDGTSGDDLISAADRALYRARLNGRNRVEFAEPDDPAPEVEGAVG